MSNPIQQGRWHAGFSGGMTGTQEKITLRRTIYALVGQVGEIVLDTSRQLRVWDNGRQLSDLFGSW